MSAYVWVVVAYVVGTLPSPYLVAVAGGRRDLIAKMRRSDSPGDAHFIVTKQMSGALGIASIVMDIVKGVVPAVAAQASGVSDWTMAWLSVAAVVGHCYPPYARRSGGRGLTTAAGVALVAAPTAMIAAGVISLIGTILRRGGLATSIGFGLLPVFAVVAGYPTPIVMLCAGALAVIWARRLEGLAGDRRAGVGFGRAVLGRLLFDLPRGGRGQVIVDAPTESG